jgi:oligopeptide transport system substrate-binding protein
MNSLSKLAATAVVVACLCFASCHDRAGSALGRSVFRYNESSGINTLDPAYAKDQAHTWVCSQLYNGLVQLDSSLNIQPCIASSWEISGDGLSYTFHIRQDVHFHSGLSSEKGRRVSAPDFVFSLQRLVDEKVASPGRWVMNQVARVDNKLDISSTDDSTLIIRLSEAFPPFLSLLSMPYCSVVPKELVGDPGRNFARNPVGTGPFQFKYWKEGVRLVLNKNEHYFEQEDGRHLPYLDAVSISFIADKQSAFLEFMQGRLDFLSGVDASFKDELLTAEGTLNPKYNGKIQFSSADYLNTEYLGFLVDEESELFQSSVLRDPRIRQAISYGFDRAKMIRYLRNNAGTAGTGGIVPPGLPTFGQPAVQGYDFNPDLSRRLLAEAGYPNGKGLPVIPLMTTASYLDLCTFIQAELKKVGIPISIELLQPSALREMISQSKVLFFRASWIADYPDPENYLSLFYSPNYCPAGPNYTHYRSPDFDRLYREAMGVNDSRERAAIYRQMGELVMQDAPVVILYYDRVSRFSKPYVKGLPCNAMNMLQLKTVTIER